MNLRIERKINTNKIRIQGWYSETLGHARALLTQNYWIVQGQEKKTRGVQLRPHPVPRIHNGGGKSHFNPLDVSSVLMCTDDPEGNQSHPTRRKDDNTSVVRRKRTLSKEVRSEYWAQWAGHQKPKTESVPPPLWRLITQNADNGFWYRCVWRRVGPTPMRVNDELSAKRDRRPTGQAPCCTFIGPFGFPRQFARENGEP